MGATGVLRQRIDPGDGSRRRHGNHLYPATVARRVDSARCPARRDSAGNDRIAHGLSGPHGHTSRLRGCRVLVVSNLLRELIHALEASQPCTRDDALMTLTLFEITHADTQALGVPLPRDKRLR